MRKKLFLFDIDGTLISPGPAARKSINKAIENHIGVAPDLQIKDVAGLTDRLIAKNAIEKFTDGESTDGAVKKIVDDYLKMFELEYHNSDGAFIYDDSIILVKKVINSNMPIGLLTGNVKRGAEIKLGKFNLMKYFKFGAYGDNANSRNDLPEIALEAAKQKLGINFNYSDTILVGDTPEDAIAAKTNGCQSIVVCRHSEWYDDIKAAGADLIVESLADPQIVKEYLS